MALFGDKPICKHQAQQPRASFSTSTSAATLTYFHRSRKERCYHGNKKNTFCDTNARYCIAWECPELLIGFGGGQKFPTPVSTRLPVAVSLVRAPLRLFSLPLTISVGRTGVTSPAIVKSPLHGKPLSSSSLRFWCL